MGLEWIDTWAGLAGFVAVLAWFDDLNKRLDDFKDFVLTLIGGTPRRRVSDASDSSSDSGRRAEN